MKQEPITEESEIISTQTKGKKIKKQKEKLGSSTNLTASEKASTAAAKRTSKVGTYKEKIKDIVSEDDELEQEEEDLLFEGLENIDDDEARKNEKSRISAKMTRKRRKYYIQLLEKKVKQVKYLNNELDQAKLKISGFEQSQKQRQNSEIMTQLLQERQKLFDKLEQKIKEKDDVEIECTMDSLRLRLGLSGKTRNQALASFYDEIVKLMMPFHMKYLIWIALENIFQSERDTDSTDSVWFQNSGMSETQIAEIRQKILESKKDYDDILHHLDILKQKMHQQNEFAQNFIDDLRNFFPPINIAKFLVDLDKKRNLYERNNLYPDCYWEKLQSKNSSLNPLKSNNQGQRIERPFQNNPNIISLNTQIKQEIQGDNSNNDMKMRNNQDVQNKIFGQQQYMRNNVQSLNSSQCSFSVDQLGLSGCISQQQQIQSNEIKSEDGRKQTIPDPFIRYIDNQTSNQNHSAAQNISYERNRNLSTGIMNNQIPNNNQNPSQNQQSSFNYDKFQYTNSNVKDNQQYVGQYNNNESQEQHQQTQFERPQNLPQYANSQSNYTTTMNQNQQYQNSQTSIQIPLEQSFQNNANQSNLQNRSQFQQQSQQPQLPQQHQYSNNNSNTNSFEYIPHSGSFQFSDPNQNFDLFLLQRDLN